MHTLDSGDPANINGIDFDSTQYGFITTNGDLLCSINQYVISIRVISEPLNPVLTGSVTIPSDPRTIQPPPPKQVTITQEDM